MRARFIDCPEFLAGLYTGDIATILPELEVDIGSPSEAETVARLEGCALMVNDHTPMPARVLERCPDLRAIGFMGTGASSYIDLDAAARRGIVVRTVRGYGDRSVAEHALALMLAAARQVAAMDRGIRGGRWETRDGIELRDRTLGIVGTGGIGREMAAIGAALGMRVLAWNRSGVPAGLPAESAALDDLLRAADVVSLHLALTAETRGLLGAERLALLRPGAILVNTARGALVDEEALLAALDSGRLGHAALDVFADEPLPSDHPLGRRGDVTLTAHAGFMTREASERLLRMTLEALREERDRLAAGPA